MAYGWCSVIYANRKEKDWRSLLLICLKLGFRHLDPWEPNTRVTLTHTEHHRGLADVVFESRNREAIADLLCAWTSEDYLPEPAGEMVGICTGHLVALHNLVPFSPRLQRLVIRFIGVAGHEGFGGAGVEKLIELLDRLHVTVEEIDSNRAWASLLLVVIRSPEGTQRLSHRYWELLVELAVLNPWSLMYEITDRLKIAKSLTEAREWEKLECWIGIVWMSSEWGGITEEDLETSTLLLLRQRPGATQRLEQWMKQWSQRRGGGCVPEPFQRILTRAHEVVQRQVAL